jgi:hypothetical protein
MAEYVIDIPDWQPTPLNKLMGSWHTRNRLKHADYKVIWAYSLGKDGKTIVPYGQVKRSVELIVTLEPRQRAPDPDSLWKVTLDGLVRAYALWNDSPKWCELLPVKFGRGEHKATRIVLRDLA